MKKGSSSMGRPFLLCLMAVLTAMIYSTLVLSDEMQEALNQGDFEIIRMETIRKRLMEEILSRIRWPRELVNIEILSGARDVILPRGDIRWEIMIPKGGIHQGNTSIRLVFSVDGKIRDSIWVSLRIHLYRPVVVASRPIERNSSLGPEDIRLEPIQLDMSMKAYLTNLDQAKGKVAKRSIASGEPITMDILESPPMVRSGAIVTMVAEKGSLIVTALGQTREKGCYGDVIKVINLNSKKVVYGTVVDSRTVKVEF